MPGLVIANRRWIIGADDLIIPGFILLLAHSIWVAIYGVVAVQNGHPFLRVDCAHQLTYHLFGQLMLILGCAILEGCIIKVSFKGSILNTKARSALNALLYIRFDLRLVILYYHNNFSELKFFNLFVWLLLLLVIWCTFDSAGRSWVKMKKFNESLKEENPKYKYRRSKNSQRNWRNREAARKYEKTWDKRFRNCCCVLNMKNPRENSFAEIAKLLSEFFRDLDVVPSDVIAGLSICPACRSPPRRPSSTWATPVVVQEVGNLIHYLHYCLAIYGWPMYLVANSPADWCALLKHTKCCANVRCGVGCGCLARRARRIAGGQEGGSSGEEEDLGEDLEDDNEEGGKCGGQRKPLAQMANDCCLCNRAAIRQTCASHQYKLIYLTYRVAVEKPPFFVAVDYEKAAVVVSIRGTLSLYDVLTDLNAEHELLPTEPRNEQWYGHRGMVASAEYIRKKLFKKRLLEKALAELKKADQSSSARTSYPIVIVGHSLGAGTAAILSILLKQVYSNVACFAFAPPGGLLSEAAAEYSKDFVISIVHGKDLVPRIGLHQMEKLRFDLIHAIKNCGMAKWSLILKSCCLGGGGDISMEEFVRRFRMQAPPQPPVGPSDEEAEKERQFDEFKKLSIHPNDESISLTVHTPLFLPGSIIHLVRHHPNQADFANESKWRQLLRPKTPIMQALWADNKDFNEILISPTHMIKDHMPDQMLAALQSLLTTTGPGKPMRNDAAAQQSPPPEKEEEEEPSQASGSTTPSGDASTSGVVAIETSFTAAQTGEGGGVNLMDQHRLRRLRSLVRKGRAPLATPERSFSGSLSSADVASKIETAAAKGQQQQQPTKKPEENEEEFLGVRVDAETTGKEGEENADATPPPPPSNQIPCTATIH
ncbi:hypothetical protein TYRP_000572 [Tyrophagus putrescentiae]|nr:hypothetical protein TYRP_000572 [Tyrophagus putrescentiae]